MWRIKNGRVKVLIQQLLTNVADTTKKWYEAWYNISLQTTSVKPRLHFTGRNSRYHFNKQESIYFKLLLRSILLCHHFIEYFYKTSIWSCCWFFLLWGFEKFNFQVYSHRLLMIFFANTPVTVQYEHIIKWFIIKQ